MSLTIEQQEFRGETPQASAKTGASPAFKALDVNGPRKTLILCPIGLGNFLMAAPCLKMLSEAIGKENLHLLALKGAIRSMGDATGYFSQIHEWDPDKQPKSIGLKLMQKLRAEKFDYSISLFPSGNWKFMAFAAVINAKKRIGFVYPNDKLPKIIQSISAPLDYSLHDTDQNSALIEALLGLGDDSKRVIDFPYTPDHAEIEQLRNTNYYVCHPGSSAERGMKEKRLPPAAFAKLVTRLHDDFGLKCLLIGGPEEKELRDEIAAKSPPEAVLNTTSRTFEELGGLIAPAQFYLGNDSGLMHVSVALGKRCIAFFGPTDERRTGPYADSLRHGSTPHLIVRREDLECAPCWTIKTVGKNPPCIYGDTRCLQQMNVDLFWPKVREFVVTLQQDRKVSATL